MNQPIHTLVDDNGYYSHKTAYFDANGKIRTDKYATVIGTGQEAQTNLSGELMDMYEDASGSRYVCNDSVSHPIAVRSDSYGTSTANRILVNHGLVRANKVGQKIRLATALPLRDYQKPDGRHNEKLINAQAESMKEPVYQALSAQRNEKPIAEIVQSEVLCEGVSAAIDFLINDDGSYRVAEGDLMADIAVMDFGGSTFDVVAMTKDLRIKQGCSGTHPRGTLDIRSKFATLLGNYFEESNIGSSGPTGWQVEQAMTTGRVSVFRGGEPTKYDVSHLLKEAKAPVVAEVKRFAEEKLQGLGGYQYILLTGGGGLLCEDLFEDWIEEYGMVVRDEYANARGMLKFITYVRPQTA